MKKKIIHVNSHVLRSNRKNNKNNPAITVKTSKTNDYGHLVIICDEEGNEVARIVHKENKPKSCGARVWVETKKRVKIINTGKLKKV